MKCNIKNSTHSILLYQHLNNFDIKSLHNNKIRLRIFDT